MKKILLIGGTGTISMAISRRLLEEGYRLYLLNRGNRINGNLAAAEMFHCDISDEAGAAETLKDLTFDVVADFIAFTPEQVERDYRLFKGKTKQYVFISSASAYQKPLADYRVTEGTPFGNTPGTKSPARISSWESTGKKGSPSLLYGPAIPTTSGASPWEFTGKTGAGR